jgi:hypothetical protein
MMEMQKKLFLVEKMVCLQSEILSVWWNTTVVRRMPLT